MADGDWQREATYSVKTWDTNLQAFTPQVGVPSTGPTLWQLKRALTELRRLGYVLHSVLDADGCHGNNDPFALVEREDLFDD